MSRAATKMDLKHKIKAALEEEKSAQTEAYAAIKAVTKKEKEKKKAMKVFDDELIVLRRNVRTANATKKAKTLARLGLEGKDPVVRNNFH